MTRRAALTATTIVVLLLGGVLARAAVVGRDDRSPDAAGPPATAGPGPSGATPCGGATAPGSTMGPGSGAANQVPPPGPSAIVGTVRDGTCGRGVAGIIVDLFPPQSATVIGSTTTGSDGSFQFPSVADGSYRLAFSDLSGAFVTTYYPDAADLDGARVVSLARTRLPVDAVVYTPATQPVDDYRGSGGGGRTVVIGDSLVQQTTSVLRQKLEPLGPTSIRGISQQRVDEMLPVARRYAAMHPANVVIALGNNDIRQHRGLPQVMTSVQDMIDLFPDARCVSVLTINSHTLDAGFNDGATAFNQRLAELARADRRVHIIDWDEVVRLLQSQGLADSTWFTDGLHLNANGAGAYGTAVQGGVQRCSS